MSDTRAEASQEMVEAGLQSSMEDTLASSLSDSFSPPSLAKPHRPATEVGTTQASGAVAAEPETESTPVPGMDDWKPTYDAYVSEWQKEADVAREKALRNRKYYEDEAERKAKAEKDEEALRRRREREEKRAEEGRQRLRRELAGEVKPTPAGSGGKKSDEDKVKEAWEMVKGDEAEGREVTTDARGVMPQDIKAGQAVEAGKERKKVQQTMYDPTTSTEPLPPNMKPTPASSTSAGGPRSHPSESQSQAASRHSATSQAWEEISGSPSSAEDISPGSASGFTSSDSGHGHGRDRAIQPTPVPKSKSTTAASGNRDGQRNPEKSLSLTGSNNHNAPNAPPSQPPSLTLSLFTSPANLSISRVVAVLGINLLLPFINGVMLGFGEIFAREAVKVGRMVFRGERSFLGWGKARREGWGEAEQGQQRGMGAGRGVAGVGLSGSGGFP